MPDIKDSVGEGVAKNNVHDIALVQAMLKVVKNAKGKAYLGSNYDGIYDGITKTGIIKFQQDNNIIPADPAKAAKILDKLGFIAKNGPTIQKLNNVLPASHQGMMIIPNTKTVYLSGNAADAKASKNSVSTDANLVGTFRNKVGQLIDRMYQQYKIVLKTTRTGRRRTFAEQAAILPPASYAGPGESNHNFGRAVDIGFRHMKWVKGDGTIHKDADWLNALEGTTPAKARAFWDARDAIAINSLGLFRLGMERVHLQDYNQTNISSARSLAKLLTKVGNTKWQGVPVPKNSTYKSDLGYGKGLFNVGSARTIWAGNANVTKAMLAKAKAVKISTITKKDVNKAKSTLKADFQAAAAAAGWQQWKPVP